MATSAPKKGKSSTAASTPAPPSVSLPTRGKDIGNYERSLEVIQSYTIEREAIDAFAVVDMDTNFDVYIHVEDKGEGEVGGSQGVSKGKGKGNGSGMSEDCLCLAASVSCWDRAL